MKPRTAPVTCPHCGHTQDEPVAAYSTVCRQCRRHIRLDGEQPADAGPAPLLRILPRDVRHVACFNCGVELEVPAQAQSTMCKRCSSHVDLRDYRITGTESKNFRTRGRFVIEEGGCVLNSEIFAGEAVLKGQLIGRLTADSLEIHNTARIKGGLHPGNLIIPSGVTFHWPETLAVGGADIRGELVACLKASGVVTVRATARLFGDVESGGLVVEPGAVLVGAMRIRPTDSKRS